MNFYFGKMFMYNKRATGGSRLIIMTMTAAVFLWAAVNPLYAATNTVSNTVEKVICENTHSEADDYPELGIRLLYYVPNRLLDLIDIFRLRAKLGPGLSANVQLTESLSFYAGRHKAVWAGLPGPRGPYKKFRAPAGIEDECGIRFMGIDATENTPHHVYYSPSEADIGLHLLLAGLEAGFDVVEMADFWSGFLMFDLRKDDIERRSRIVPAPAYNVGWNMFDEMKPDRFEKLSERLDYLEDNLPLIMNTKTRELDCALSGRDIDEYSNEFADENLTSKLRVGIFMEVEKDHGYKIKFDPDYDVEVKLPGLEQRWNLYISKKQVDELPGTLPSERENGLNVGLSRRIGKMGVRTSVGVKARWPPQAFATIKWGRRYNPGKWYLTPNIRGYYKSDKGFGQVTSLTANHWLNKNRTTLFRSTSAGRFTRDSTGWDWEQSLILGYVRDVIQGEKRRDSLDSEDVAYGIGISATVFGHLDNGDSLIDRYRTRLVFRKPIYNNWIYLEVSPELEWKNEQDWDTIYLFRIGLDMLFYGVTEN
jgi:hypothetical protein